MKELTGLSVWTIGHSTHPWTVFVDLLKMHRVACVADVRRFPGSRKHPHFNAASMSESLPESGIEYLPLPELGGRRKPSPDSLNDAWRNVSFQGYADHLESEEYQAGRDKLVDNARRVRTAMLCSEAVWWRCHRRLIADDLKVAGAEVLHIINRSPPKEHPVTSAARIIEGKLAYPAAGRIDDAASSELPAN